MGNGAGYLSKREQQIMEVIYTRNGVTAAELCEYLPGTPSNATVRTLLRILEEKGQVTHQEDAGRFVYYSAQSRQSAARQALNRLVDTFFDGSISDVLAALVKDERHKLSFEEIERLEQLISEAKEAE